MKTYLELVRATAKNMFRDRMVLFWFLAFPLLFILLFGTIFSNDAIISDFPIGLVGDDGEVSRALHSALDQAEAFTVHTGSREGELEALQDGSRQLVILLPPDPDTLLARGEQLEIYFYYDEQNQAVNRVLVSSVSEILQEIERGMTGRPRVFIISAEAVQADNLRPADFLIPGVLAMALMQLGLFGSLHIVGLRERKVLRQLNVTPLPRGLLIASEITVRLFLAMIQTVLILVIGHLFYKVNVVGSWPALIGIVILGAAVFVSFGYMLTCFVKSEESGNGVIQLVQFPMMFLSGIFFPIEVMPDFIKPIMKAIPLTYLADLLRHEITGWAPLHTPATNLAVLGGWLIVSLFVAVRFFRWE
ncbi:MAG: ABC transporter permease [Firmicutes bacterium]|nr:ABC transporter permease [Bacillota bacterium]